MSFKKKWVKIPEERNSEKNMELKKLCVVYNKQKCGYFDFSEATYVKFHQSRNYRYLLSARRHIKLCRNVGQIISCVLYIDKSVVSGFDFKEGGLNDYSFFIDSVCTPHFLCSKNDIIIMNSCTFIFGRSFG